MTRQPTPPPLTDDERDTLNAAHTILHRCATDDLHPTRPVARMRLNRLAGDADGALVKFAHELAWAFKDEKAV